MEGGGTEFKKKSVITYNKLEDLIKLTKNLMIYLLVRKRDRHMVTV